MAPRTAAASATVRVCGPTVSWECEMGMTPARLTRPTVGLIPTTPFAVAGQTIEPSRDVLGVRVELDDRVERRIDALDAREVRLHERARGEVALRHRRLELDDGRLLKVELAFVIVVRRGGRGADEGCQGGNRRGSAGQAQEVAAS